MDLLIYLNDKNYYRFSIKNYLKVNKLQKEYY